MGVGVMGVSVSVAGCEIALNCHVIILLLLQGVGSL